MNIRYNKIGDGLRKELFVVNGNMIILIVRIATRGCTDLVSGYLFGFVGCFILLLSLFLFVVFVHFLTRRARHRKGV